MRWTCIRTPCIIQVCDAACNLLTESKAALSRRGGARLADFFLLSGTTRLSTNPTTVRFSRSRLHEREIPCSYIIPTWIMRGGSSSPTTRELMFCASSKSRSAAGGFGERTSVSRDPFLERRSFVFLIWLKFRKRN